MPQFLLGRQMNSDQWEKVPLVGDAPLDTFDAIICATFLTSVKVPDDAGVMWAEIKFVDSAGNYIGGHFHRSPQERLAL